MIQTITVPQERYDTRMYCNLVYSNASTKSAAALPLHCHVICPRGTVDEKFPLLIYVGGGGWRVSAPERHLPELSWFAAKGFVIASIEYRTTANARFPVQIEDVKTAIRYLRNNCNQFQIDPERVFMMGGSAGGYLTAMAALTGGSDRFRGEENLDVSDELQGAICLYGLFDFSPYGKVIQKNMVAALPISLYLPDTEDATIECASPITYVHKEAPPFLLLHGNADRMVSCQQSIDFYNALQMNNLNPEMYILDGVDHADSAFSQPLIQKIILDYLDNIIKKMEMKK